jgi:hypothetical protein
LRQAIEIGRQTFFFFFFSLLSSSLLSSSLHLFGAWQRYPDANRPGSVNTYRTISVFHWSGAGSFHHGITAAGGAIA